VLVAEYVVTATFSICYCLVVSNLAGAEEAQKEDARSGAIAERRLRRSKRLPKPNAKYYGPQWDN
jgi:hypothetical protein